MLNTQKLEELRKIINLRALCEQSEVRYSTIYQRLQRKCVLRPQEKYLLTKGLEKFGLFLEGKD
jgi:hypothetical protein